ncbi:MAG: hypothetical protein M3Z50_09595 [Actinomycetota bacterium]|nr:hypothetical protein [Actinomycetota bacterium]
MPPATPRPESRTSPQIHEIACPAGELDCSTVADVGGWACAELVGEALREPLGCPALAATVVGVPEAEEVAPAAELDVVGGFGAEEVFGFAAAAEDG